MADFNKGKGNKTLQKVAEKSSIGAIVTMLDISSLSDNPDNEYLFGMKDSDIEHTANGIKSNGFRGAINVYQKADGTYEVYSGHIRKYACIKLGIEKIPCLVEPEPTEESIKRRQLLGANLYGRNKVTSDNPLLVARQIHYHRETLELEGFKGDKRKELALEFGIAESQVYKYEALLNLEAPLQDIVASGKAPWTALYDLGNKMDASEQKHLAEVINMHLDDEDNHLSKSLTKKLADEILGIQPIKGQMVMDGIRPTEGFDEYADLERPEEPEEDEDEESDAVPEEPAVSETSAVKKSKVLTGADLMKMVSNMQNALESCERDNVEYHSPDSVISEYRHLIQLIEDEMERLNM